MQLTNIEIYCWY